MHRPHQAAPVVRNCDAVIKSLRDDATAETTFEGIEESMRTLGCALFALCTLCCLMDMDTAESQCRVAVRLIY